MLPHAKSWIYLTMIMFKKKKSETEKYNIVYVKYEKCITDKSLVLEVYVEFPSGE